MLCHVAEALLIRGRRVPSNTQSQIPPVHVFYAKYEPILRTYVLRRQGRNDSLQVGAYSRSATTIISQNASRGDTQITT